MKKDNLKKTQVTFIVQDPVKILWVLTCSLYLDHVDVNICSCQFALAPAIQVFSLCARGSLKSGQQTWKRCNNS